MGVDINIFPEYSVRPHGHWLSFCEGVNAGRDREIFQLMGLAGCNLPGMDPINPLFALRGLPPDLATDATDNAFISVDGDWRTHHVVSRTEAEDLIKEGKSRWYDSRQTRILNPYLRGYTWLYCHEYKRVLETASEASAEWWGLLALIEELERRELRTRLVIWFDD